MQHCPQCGERPTSADQVFCSSCTLPLQLVAGKYHIQKKLSEGGCGILYLAKHIRLSMDPWRVIKFLKPEYFSHPSASTRFAHEVEITAALSQKSKHIVRVYDDFGTIYRLGRYYVMEYLQGEDLHQLLKREKEVSHAFALQVMEQVTEAVINAHQAGIIHRDLKPQNIYLPKEEEGFFTIKLIDFGIAKRLAAHTNIALTKGVIGTPEYMAPEQCVGGQIDERTDIYALGVILYQLLVGRTPFFPKDSKGITPMQISMAQISEEPKPPSEVRPDKEFSPALEAVVLKALQKNPRDRFQTAQEFKDALLAIKQEDRTVQVRPETLLRELFPKQNGEPLPTGIPLDSPSQPPLPTDEPSHFQTDEPQPPATRKRKIIGLTIAIVVLLEVFIVAWFLYGREDKTASNTTAKTSSPVKQKLLSRKRGQFIQKRVKPKHRLKSSKLPPPKARKKPKTRKKSKNDRKKRRTKRTKQTKRRIKRTKRNVRPKKPTKYRKYLRKHRQCPKSTSKGHWVWVRYSPSQLKIFGTMQRNKKRNTVCLFVTKNRFASATVFFSAKGYQECRIHIPPQQRKLTIKLEKEPDQIAQLQLRRPMHYCIK